MNRIVNLMIERRLISEEERELYLYGLQLLSEKLFGLCSMLLICILCSRFFEGAVFYIAYSFIRKYAGGFHAGRYITCYLSSCLTVFVCCALSSLSVAPLLSAVTAVVSVPLIFTLAPVEHNAKPLDLCESKLYRKRTRIVLICEMCVYALLFVLRCYNLCFSISFAWGLLSVLLLIQTVKNRKYMI